MDRIMALSWNVIGYGGLLAVAGLALIITIIFAVPGVILLAVGLAMVVAGFVLQVGAAATHGVQAAVGLALAGRAHAAP